MKLDLILDRIEEGSFAVLTDEKCLSYECAAELLPLGAREGASLTGEIDESGNVLSLTYRENIHAGDNTSRLRALFNRNKNKE